MGLKFRNGGDDGVMTLKEVIIAVEQAKELFRRDQYCKNELEYQLADDVLLLARALWEREKDWNDWAPGCGIGGQFQQGLDELKEALDANPS